MKESIKITKAALADRGNGDIILRGVIDPASLPSLLVGNYQRGVQPRNYLRGIMKGFENSGGVPDIALGMRGHSFTEAEGNFFLHDPIYIIDGLQRQTAALEALKNGIQPKLGVTIHFDTTEVWETKRFELLNMNRAKVAAGVLIRNLSKDNPAIKMLYDLGLDSSFALANRVSWDQRMERGQIIQDQVLLKAVAQLHRRLGPGLTSGRHAVMSAGLEKLMDRIGPNTLRDNIKRYWDVLDECFNVRGIEIASAPPYTKGGFLKTMSKVFADHQDFWTDSTFTIPSDLRRKLRLFKIHEPTTARLCGSSGVAQTQLYFLIVTHLDRGKRNRRLKKFDFPEFMGAEREDDEEAVPTSLLAAGGSPNGARALFAS
jgi:hypothetical protein